MNESIAPHHESEKEKEKERERHEMTVTLVRSLSCQRSRFTFGHHYYSNNILRIEMRSVDKN